MIPENIDEAGDGGLPPRNGSASLAWKQSGEEWQAESTPGAQYVAMPFDGTWHAFLFLGTRYKRGYTLASELATADEAQQKCQDHLDAAVAEMASAMAAACPQNDPVEARRDKTPPSQ